DAPAVRHVINEHGSATTEMPRGQGVVTADDIGRVPDIIARADRVARIETGHRLQGFEFRLTDGATTIVVMTERRGRGNLSFHTMRIMSGGTQAARDGLGTGTTSRLYGRTAPGVAGNIQRSARASNP